jgi:starch synthase (maltosyl-transferring)
MLGEDLRALMQRCDLRANRSRYGRELEVVVDRTAAAFAAWYEIFPRSMSDDPSRHGTFDDVIAKLPYVQGMGFDVLYFPPIHPIGRKNRKGRNNSLTAQPDDPAALRDRAAEGGHKAIHPELGDEDDFRRLVAAAHDHGLEIALDFAIQAAPTTPGSPSGRSGSTGGPTGRSSTPRTRPRSTRTSRTSSSTTAPCRRCGTSCGTRSCTGSTWA